MKPVSIGRHCLVISTSILLLVAVSFSIAAIATPSWQTVYLAEFQSEHEHGLWMDCTITRRYSQGFINYHQHCTYKFENAYFPDGGGVHQEEEQHKFHGKFKFFK
uniref:Uncharacterized protein n=1 Tax=Panagrolaimus superbus TaxID=310955 RepID=A0A914Y8M3_9BILA